MYTLKYDVLEMHYNVMDDPHAATAPMGKLGVCFLW
jgi:hypothetical protein